MSKNRIKPTVRILTSRAQAENQVQAIALLSAAKQVESGRMDKEILAVKEKYAPRISEMDATIQLAAQELEVWAQSNPNEFPAGRKSIAFLAGTIGFRKDTPSLQPLSKAFTWTKILATITGKKWRRFIRQKPEVDKDAILARAGTLDKPTKFQREVLPLLGLRVVQEEKFFVQPDLTKLTTPEVK